MKITSLSVQKKNKDRVNVFIDGKYRLSLSMSQIVEFSLKKDLEVTEQVLVNLEKASEFGKLFSKALEYSLLRPRSSKEIEDYLRKKSVDEDCSTRILDKLKASRYVDDRRFAEYWINNRFTKKGISRRRLEHELAVKGVHKDLVKEIFEVSNRDDVTEIKKIIDKKSKRYADKNKLLAYLLRQGFGYEDSKKAIANLEED